MLWRIRNFKGLNFAEIDIREGKTTVLTGVNSSGKSSIIQSLLLIAQSLQNENKVVLNGPLVRLGDAQELVREGSESGAIELGLGLVSEDNAIEDDELQATFDLVAAEDRSALRVRRLRISSSMVDDRAFELGRQNARKSDVSTVMSVTEHLGARDALHLKSLLGSDRRQLRTYVVVQGLRPVAVVQLMNPADLARRFRNLLEALLHERETGSTKAATVATARIGASAMIREFVRLLLRSGGPMNTKAFSGARMGNPYAFHSVWEQIKPADRQALIDQAVSERMKSPAVVVPVGRSGYPAATGLLESQLLEALGPTYDALNALSDTLDTIADRVQYLGPLRDEPRVVWNHWNELARGLPVGTRGEYSAAVLSRWSAESIRYVPPGSSKKAESGSQTTIAPLSDAVNQWLTYLEIGDAVAARSHGKLGVGLELRMNGKDRDLTAVGVGVSQALPLLVGLLTSPYGSIFIVEQPELHLHPAVQSRLADLLLYARPDLTLVIETHSESFVTRIRRRAAEGSVDLADVDITFVELGSYGSRARVLALSQFGDLSDWPEGFLSGAEEDIRAILSANVQRMRSPEHAD